VTARIGIYGYYWHLDAGDVFVLPDGLQDAVKAMLSLADEPAETEGLDESEDASCAKP
jgi:acylphosphatase